MPKKTSPTVDPTLSPTLSVAAQEPAAGTSGAMTFQDAYQRLQDAVQTVRSASAEDLDTLVTCVKQGAEAHAVCKARIQAVRALLADYGVADTPEQA